MTKTERALNAENIRLIQTVTRLESRVSVLEEMNTIQRHELARRKHQRTPTKEHTP